MRFGSVFSAAFSVAFFLLSPSFLLPSSFSYLERVEDRLELVLEKTDFARRVVMKGGVGLGMVFFGLHFSHLVAFIHTLRVTGLPVIQRAWREFLDMYTGWVAGKEQTP